MKSIFKILFFFIFISSYAQEETNRIEIPKLNTGVFGDKLQRIITAGEEGAVIRFVNNSNDKAMWNQDELIGFIIEKYALDSTSSEGDIAFAVGDFIKYGGIEKHIQGYALMVDVLDLDSNKLDVKSNFTSLFDVPSRLCSDFSKHFCILSKNVSKELGIEMEVAMLFLNGHVVAEYFDSEEELWVIVDTDPQSKLFIPRINDVPISIDELLKNPSLILMDDDLINYNPKEGIQYFWLNMRYKELERIFSEAQEIKREIIDFSELAFDYYIKLAPNQRLVWSYDVDALFLNQNKCQDLFFAAYESFESEDSTTIVDALITYADCQEVDPMLVLPRILGERPIFSDSTFFGKEDIRLNTFQTFLPAAKYDTSSVYIPNLIKRVEGALVFDDKTSLVDFDLDLFYFDEYETGIRKEVLKDQLHYLKQGFEVKSEELMLEFYSNDQINFDVNSVSGIAVIKGELSVEHWVNGEKVWTSPSSDN